MIELQPCIKSNIMRCVCDFINAGCVGGWNQGGEILKKSSDSEEKFSVQNLFGVFFLNVLFTLGWHLDAFCETL